MLSGEVGYFRGVMQLTHPAFLVLDSRPGRTVGTKSLKTIAETATGQDGDLDMSAFDRDFFPIYRGSSKLQSWDIYACVRQVLDVLDPIGEPLPDDVVRRRQVVGQDTALRDIHLAENEADRERARERLTIDEAVGLQWALAQRRHGELARSGPSAPQRPDGLLAAMSARLPSSSPPVSRPCCARSPRSWPRTGRCTGCCRARSAPARPSCPCWPCCRWSTPVTNARCWLPPRFRRPARAVDQGVLGPLAMGGQLGGVEGATRVALLTGSMSAAQKRQCVRRSPPGRPGS